MAVYGHQPVFSRLEVTYVQDGNTLGTTSDCEELTIALETQLPSNTEDPFLVIKTPSGFSMDNDVELNELIKRCYQAWEVLTQEADT